MTTAYTHILPQLKPSKFYLTIGSVEEAVWLCDRELDLDSVETIELDKTSLPKLKERIKARSYFYRHTKGFVLILPPGKNKLQELLPLERDFSLPKSHYCFIVPQTEEDRDKISTDYNKIKGGNYLILDLRSNIRSVVAGSLETYYQHSPYVLERKLAEGLSAREIEAEWELNRESVLEGILKSLFLSDAPSRIMNLDKATFSKYFRENAGEAPLFAQYLCGGKYYRYGRCPELGLYLSPFLDLANRVYLHYPTYPLAVWALWVIASKVSYGDKYCKGLESKVSKAGNIYHTFTPSKTAIAAWSTSVDSLL